MYVVIRLATLATRQIPNVENHTATRVTVAVCSILAIVVVSFCTLDTLGLGLDFGASIDAEHGRTLPSGPRAPR